jgi:hypothetical protein
MKKAALPKKDSPFNQLNKFIVLPTVLQEFVVAILGGAKC